jgi:hypothetical protein
MRSYAIVINTPVLNENSDFIWRNYGNGSSRGKVCCVFEFGKLRSMLNNIFGSEHFVLEYKGLRCQQIFIINYGLVEYVDWSNHQANKEHLPNPIKYLYLKDKQKFHEEKELRISLSTIGIGNFKLSDGSIMDFPSYLPMAFDFRAAIANNTIREILYAADCDSNFLFAELQKLGVVP